MKTPALTGICLFLATLTTTASAADLRTGDGNALLNLATQYDASIDSFERVIKRVRGIDRADLSLVNRLDNAAARLKKASKNPRYLNQLYSRLRDVMKLHAEVEQRVFGKYTIHHDLLYCWRVANYHHALFVDEYVLVVENPDHVRNVRRLQSSSQRRENYLRFDVGTGD